MSRKAERRKREITRKLLPETEPRQPSIWLLIIPVLIGVITFILMVVLRK